MTLFPNKRPALTLLELLVVLAILALGVGIALSAVQRVRASAAKLECQHHLRQLALASHNYHDTHHHLPAGWTSDADAKSLMYLGWSARLLPQLERDSQWRQIEAAFAGDPNRKEFYGHAPHAVLLAAVVSAFVCPADGRLVRPQSPFSGITVASTSYLGVVGRNGFQNDGLLFADSAVKFADIRDGQSNTILFGERPPPENFREGWWYRGWGPNKDGIAEMILGVRERNFASETRSCPPGPYAFARGELKNPCDIYHFWSLHAGGGNFAFADGSVRFLSYSAAAILPALATRAGNESVELP